ncbi:MAG TPA: GAF domain-containing protein [Terrimicrobiaceae bacterium]|nr:GAF domain-containing protein [Terrimicrobiaceae bacterium]
MSFPVPTNETERLAAVRTLNILDTAPEIAYDEIGELAAEVCQCPVAYISLMSDDRLWLKAKYGLPPDFNQCPREISFCATTVCGTEMVVASDLRQDARFSEIPFVTGEPYFKFYCGVPLITVEGYALGTLCVVDFEPRQLTFNRPNR